jgi:hypothetical protein
MRESECLCPNYKLIFECTVIQNNSTGGGVTLFWNGSIFNNCDITLSSLIWAKVYCNEEAIVGSIMPDENSWYTSQLNITLSFETIGKSILCFRGNYDNMGQEKEIGNSTIAGF